MQPRLVLAVLVTSILTAAPAIAEETYVIVIKITA